MKKLISLALALIFCMATLAGCGSSASQQSSQPSSTGTATASTVKTINDGVLTMGTNAAFPPYEYYDGNNIVGIDPEIATLIAEKLGMKLEIVDMDFSSIITSVQTGKIDIGMAGMTVTPERQKNVNFATSYATGVQVVIVPENSSIKSVDDLNAMLKAGQDFLIGTQEGTTGFTYASDTPENGGFGQDHVVAYTNGATAVQALKDGKVDCVIIDNEPAKAYVAANPGLKILDTAYVQEDYAIAVSKDNQALLDAINNAIQELTADGSIKAVLDKYITATPAAQ